MEVEELLETRGDTYGQYIVVSRISQDIQKIMKSSPNYETMPNYMRESLDMIANKLARILNGDPHYLDSWSDIAGYVTLVKMEIEDHEPDNH